MFFSKIIFTPFIFGCCSSYNRADDLCSARILDLLDLADNGLVYACANGARGKAGACDPAHDAADDGMDGDFPAAAVVGQVMGKAEGFLAEGGKFLLFFDLLLIEDTSKFIQRVRRIAAQGGDVLRGIVPHINRSRCNGRLRRAVCIALGRQGKAGDNLI